MKTFLTLAAFAGLAPAASAAIIWSGLQNIDIPAGLDGVSLDPFTGASQTTPDDDFTSTDVNFFLGGAGLRTSGDFLPARTGTEATSPVRNLLPGTSVDLSLTFGPDGVGASGGPGMEHLGDSAGQFASGEQGYLGFQLRNEGDTHFGWMRVTLTANGVGTIHEWAVADVADDPISVGAIPEPSSLLLTLLGATALLRRKR
ncbi:PEP-CTERM sorting domain-containing protein [Roseibacillus ishigakijimensis]|uniref:PEP-CTERM sorting domain-containing protein n=1 Tax=Roseibacillus ishigakijimensis TaxID=454146 RepID=A0A934VNK7_9BACT|nr:PEP-CTERM sorting domain-containing protein [Roseibacillus ishigakijimensis]MBK1835412.1 PEP-CTERM sorting domain-containing protein [Roseibacillus ishigakijimensis]